MNKAQINILYNEALQLLRSLISIPSVSGQENKTAECLQEFFIKHNVPVKRLLNNVWCVNKYFDQTKPSILLNSHHDTVPAGTQYLRHPYSPDITHGKLYGLGSTDAGGALVSLAASFIYFYEMENMPFNLVFAASAEEEISGTNGIEKLFSDTDFRSCFSHPDSFGIVGEPTELELAVAQKGLMVLDCTSIGRAGHAARGEGDNALYKAMDAIAWFRNFRFEKVSAFCGEVMMNVTSIETENKSHNITPASCKFVVDIRINELYKHEEILSVIRGNVDVEIKPRSMRLKASSIDADHPVVKAGIVSGKNIYGSPTLSDSALIPFPCLKCGPGSSTQSHTADEFIFIKDMGDGIGFYINVLSVMLNT